MAGLGSALLIGMLMIAWPRFSYLWAADLSISEHSIEGKLTVIDLPPLEEPKAQEVQPPPPPPPPEAPQFKQLANLIPDPTEDELDPNDPTIHRMDSLMAAPNIGLDDMRQNQEVSSR